jgi:hypothetical protein
MGEQVERTSGRNATEAEVSHPYDDFLKDRIAAEEARKTSLEQRGIAVVSTSGTLLTLFFGLAAVITSRQGYSPPSGFRSHSAWALAFFLLATVLAVSTNLPLPYSDVRAKELNSDEMWQETSTIAKENVFDFRIALLQGLQKRNGLKALMVVAAMAAQGIAVLFVALAIWSILRAK